MEHDVIMCYNDDDVCVCVDVIVSLSLYPMFFSFHICVLYHCMGVHHDVCVCVLMSLCHSLYTPCFFLFIYVFYIIAWVCIMFYLIVCVII